MNSENGDLFQRTIALTLTLSIDCMTCMRWKWPHASSS